MVQAVSIYFSSVHWLTCTSAFRKRDLILFKEEEINANVFVADKGCNFYLFVRNVLVASPFSTNSYLSERTAT